MPAIGANQEVFSVRSEQYGHAAHLLLGGELDMATSPLLERSLEGAESNGNTSIVLDLEHVTFMDANGVHSFLRASDRASRSGRRFTIVNAPAVVRRLLQITRTTYLLGSDAPDPSTDRLSVSA